MKLLTYARESVLLGDAAADGLMAYAARLASLRLTDAVRLRVLTVGGSSAMAAFLLTPGVQLMTVTVESPYAEPDNEAEVATLRRRTADIVVAVVLEDQGRDAIFDDIEFAAATS